MNERRAALRKCLYCEAVTIAPHGRCDECWRLEHTVQNEIIKVMAIIENLGFIIVDPPTEGDVLR